VPDAPTIERHARRIIEQVHADKALRKILPEIHKVAESVALPENLMRRTRDTLQRSPGIPWDKAVADIVREACGPVNDARTKGNSM
jgi:hypothetical protein